MIFCSEMEGMMITRFLRCCLLISRSVWASDCIPSGPSAGPSVTSPDGHYQVPSPESFLFQPDQRS